MKRIAAILLMMICLVVMCTPISFADVTPDPKVTIVNPTEDTVIYSTNLLISVKVAKKATIEVEVFKEETVNTVSTATNEAGEKIETVSVTKKYTSVMEKENFLSDSDLSFYTKKLENVEIGTYKIVVTTLGSDGKATHVTERFVTIEEKPEASAETKIFNTNQSGTLTFLKNLLTSIFGN